MRKAILLTLLFLYLAPVYAQANYPSKQDIRAALKDVDYALRRFEEVSGKMNFARWDAPYDLVESSQKSLEVTLSEIRNARDWMGTVENSDRVSAFAILQVYHAVSDVAADASSFSRREVEFAKEYPLATDLAQVATLSTKAEGKLRALLWQQVEAEEKELKLCRSAKKR